MIKPGSLWVGKTFPHAQYAIGNKKMVVKRDGLDDTILYHLLPRISGMEPGYNYQFVTEMELRYDWWEVERWEEA